MSYILNIETASTNCSVALSKDGVTMTLCEDYSSKYSHAESLHIFIDTVLKKAKIKSQDIDAVAVSKGPGSYTGLRIGVSAAKGLCFSWDKPLISIDTLESLAHQIHTESGCIVSMLDARRMEVYMAVFTNTYEPIEPTCAQVVDIHSFEAFLNEGPVHFIGDGVDKTKTRVTHPNAVFVEGRLPSANNMGLLANEKYKIGDFEDVAYFEPFYLKDFRGSKP